MRTQICIFGVITLTFSFPERREKRGIKKGRSASQGLRELPFQLHSNEKLFELRFLFWS